MSESAVQDHYSDNVAHCYGCGRLNEHGLKIRTFWEGEGTVSRFRPRPEHTAVPGFVYGGLIASLIDCHATATAAAAMYRAADRGWDTQPAFRFISGSLQVDYLRPTPIDCELEIRGRIEEIQSRRVVVAVEVRAGTLLTARGEVVAVQMPKNFGGE
jgi:acyl-coenzyme A thioesterase PaaI-like protein